MKQRAFLAICIVFVLSNSCKKESSHCEIPGSTKRISSIRVSENGIPEVELHFIYDSQNRISKLIRRLNNNDMYVDIAYYANQIHIDKLGSSWESQLLNSDGYPDTILTSWNSLVAISYQLPGALAEVSTYVDPNFTLSQTIAYDYADNKLKEVQFTDHVLGGSHTDTVKYQNNKMVSYGSFLVSYEGDCLSQIVAGGSPTVTNTKNFNYMSDCNEILGIEETTVYPNSTTTKTYVFEYEDGTGTFPFLWQTPFYRIAGMPDFIGFAWNYGGI